MLPILYICNSNKKTKIMKTSKLIFKSVLLTYLFFTITGCNSPNSDGRKFGDKICKIAKENLATSAQVSQNALTNMNSNQNLGGIANNMANTANAEIKRFDSLEEIEEPKVKNYSKDDMDKFADGYKKTIADCGCEPGGVLQGLLNTLMYSTGLVKDSTNTTNSTPVVASNTSLEEKAKEYAERICEFTTRLSNLHVYTDNTPNPDSLLKMQVLTLAMNKFETDMGAELQKYSQDDQAKFNTLSFKLQSECDSIKIINHRMGANGDDSGKTPTTQAQQQTQQPQTNETPSGVNNNQGVNIVYYKIQDPDGCTNLRDAPNANGNIVRKVYPSEKFKVTTTVGKYKKVLFDDGTIGFIHESRVVESK